MIVAPSDFDDLYNTRDERQKYAPIRGTEAHTWFTNMKHQEETFYEMWKQMSLDNTITEWERRKLDVWDYPVSDRFTKIWAKFFETMSNDTWGIYDSMDHALELVRSSPGKRDGYAVIADATDVRYLSMTNCDLYQIGEEFSPKPYAVAMPKGSPLKKQIDDAILKLNDARKLENWKYKWWNQNPNRLECQEDEESTGGIPFGNFGGVFIMTIGVALIACVILLIENMYYKNKSPPSSGKVSPISVKEKTEFGAES